MNTSFPAVSARILRDFANGLQQQMFFWGQDILHPKENILVSEGFERSPSTGLKGTSCYRREWQNGTIELYGSCAGWYGDNGGFTFIRPKKRCVRWRSSDETPIPGSWQNELIDTKASRIDLYQASLPFLDWLISYEYTVLKNHGSAYREFTYQNYLKVPKAKGWIEPFSGLNWFQCLRETPEILVTPKRFAARKNAKVTERRHFN